MDHAPVPSTLSPVGRRTTVADQVYDQLRRALMRGDFDPGQLITIDSISRELGTSHMPVRDALRRLAVENGLEIALTGTAKVPEVSRARLDDICRARIEIEGLAAELATSVASPAAIAQLERILGDHEAARTKGAVFEMLHFNQLFHFGLYDLAQSEVLTQFIDTLWLQMGPYMRLLTRQLIALKTATDMPAAQNYHAQIMAALAARDARDVRQLVAADIRQSQMLLRSVIAEDAAL